MCGIVGFTGAAQAAPILLDGLAKLEYRGYDSAGLAVQNAAGKIEVVKAKGRLKVLSEMTDGGNALTGTCGIGHTRWATHGEPSVVNAHPHYSNDKKIAIVHNGIIENYLEIKERLTNKGFTFVSQTDTEVLAQLLDYYYADCGDIFEAMIRMLHAVDGAYALGIICAAGLGFLLERVILRKVKFSSFVNLLIATVGVSYVLRNASMVIWGTNPQLFPSMFPSELIEIGEFRITPQSIGIIIISLAIITGLHFFFTKVKIGKCMQLANSDPEGAAMMGVNVTYMRFLTFGISAALACIAGVMIAPLTYARVDMSATIGMKAFAAAILGGIGNLWGALLGGIILGIVEAVGSAYISTAYRDAFSFIILFIVLFVKPTGLLNKKIENKL